MRDKANIDKAYKLIDQALESLARTKRTRTRAYKLLLEARDRLSERITPADIGDLLRKVYSQDALDGLQMRHPLVPKSPA